jgi:hypothetical protein
VCQQVAWYTTDHVFWKKNLLAKPTMAVVLHYRELRVEVVLFATGNINHGLVMHSRNWDREAADSRKYEFYDSKKTWAGHGSRAV